MNTATITNQENNNNLYPHYAFNLDSTNNLHLVLFTKIKIMTVYSFCQKFGPFAKMKRMKHLNQTNGVPFVMF